MADQFAVEQVLATLSARRRVFHSEADLQFAFAWTAKELHPDVEVRLETHPELKVRLDLRLSWPAVGRHVAIELKYMTRRWEGRVGEEAFALKGHGAQDVRGYDVVKDVGRVERFVERRPGWDGYVVVLTNDASYWRPRVRTGRRTPMLSDLTKGRACMVSVPRTRGPVAPPKCGRGRSCCVASTN